MSPFDLTIAMSLVQAASDKLLGSLMLLTAAFVFTYYTIWALFLVSPLIQSGGIPALS